jgi:hypothetical protein
MKIDTEKLFTEKTLERVAGTVFVVLLACIATIAVWGTLKLLFGCCS